MTQIQLKKISGLVFLGLLMTGAIILLLVIRSDVENKAAFGKEKKRLNDIFNLLDTAYWHSFEKNAALIDEAYRISGIIGDSHSMVRALFEKGRYFQELEINDSILPVYTRALPIAERIKADTMVLMINQGIGRFYFDDENYHPALVHLTNALDLAEKMKRESSLASINNDLGLVYRNVGDPEKAIVHYINANDINKKFKKERNEASVNINIANCYTDLGKHSEAMDYLHKALDLFYKAGDTVSVNKTYVNLGASYMNKKLYPRAFDYFMHARLYCEHSKNFKDLGMIYLNLGGYFLAIDSLKQAEDYFRQSLPVFFQYGYNRERIEAYKGLAEVQKKEKNWEEAYHYYECSVQLQDSILNFQTIKKLSDCQWEFESRKQELKAELLSNKFEIKRQQNIILLILFGAALIFIIMLFFIIYLSKKKAKEKIMVQQLKNQQLEETISMDEKFREMEKRHHSTEIEAKNKELTTLSIQLLAKNNLLLAIDDWATKAFEEQKMEKINYKKLQNFLADNLNMDKDWGQFKDMFEKVHQSFFSNLKKQCPELTENEMRICAYLRINLQNKEIAKIFNVSPATVLTNRYHIRKKLNLDRKTSLENYIRQL